MVVTVPTVVILRWGDSAYDSLGAILELAGQLLAAEGLQPEIVRTDDAGWPQRVADMAAKGDVAFALTMSGMMTEIRVTDGKLYWDAIKVPLFNWNCDHPGYYPSRHAIRSPYVLHGYVFPDHARYNLTHLNPNGIAFAAHLAMPPRSVFTDAPLPLSARNGRLMLSKSGNDTNAIEAGWRRALPVARDTLFAAAEELFHCVTDAFVPTLQRIGARVGLMLDGNSTLTLDLIRELDAYIRFKRANLVVRSLLQYPIDIYGTGWDHIDWVGGVARHHGAIPWKETLARLPAYLGCLSINPLIANSVHDRVFTAIAAGVAPCSDSNDFASETLTELAPYTFTFERDRIRAAVEALLADPAAALERTETTYGALSSEYTMHHQIKRIVQFVKLRRFNARVAT